MMAIPAQAGAGVIELARAESPNSTASSTHTSNGDSNSSSTPNNHPNSTSTSANGAFQPKPLRAMLARGAA